MHRPILLTAAVVLVFLLSWKRPGPPAAPGFGIVVDQVGHQTACETGLRPGDVLLFWSERLDPDRPAWPLGGSFGSPFDLLGLAQQPRLQSRVEVTFETGDGRESTALPPSWQLRSRPLMRQHDLDDYLTGRRLLGGENVHEGLARWSDLARRRGRQRDHRTAAWLFYRIGQVLADHGERHRADRAFRTALAEIEAAGDEIAAGLIRAAHAAVTE